ncbi:MAG: dTDP-4-dehydrorhamnose reductase [Patescibacteria group bacterium]
MKRVLLIGASGQLGTDIAIAFKKKYEVVSANHKDVDILDSKKLKKAVFNIKPDIIINTAAYHKVDEIQKNAKKAFLVNALGQRNVANLSLKINATVVFMSTDYVFGADVGRRKAYTELDCPRAINTYGVTKIAGEELTKIHTNKYFIIRTSGLYGTKGSSNKGDNFVEKMINMAKIGKELNVVNDQFLSPTYTKNLAQNLLLLLKTTRFGTYHMVSRGSCSWWQFTKEIFKLLHIRVICNPVDSNYFKTEAKRPSYSVLANCNLSKIKINKMKHWKTNLKDYLEEANHIS